MKTSVQKTLPSAPPGFPGSGTDRAPGQGSGLGGSFLLLAMIMIIIIGGVSF